MEVKKHSHLSTLRSAVARLASLSAAGHLPPPDCRLSCGPEATYQMIGRSSTETAVAQKQQLATELPESSFILKAARPDFITRWQQRSNRASPCAKGLLKSLLAPLCWCSRVKASTITKFSKCGKRTQKGMDAKRQDPDLPQFNFTFVVIMYILSFHCNIIYWYVIFKFTYWF